MRCYYACRLTSVARTRCFPRRPRPWAFVKHMTKAVPIRDCPPESRSTWLGDRSAETCGRCYGPAVLRLAPPAHPVRPFRRSVAAGDRAGLGVGQEIGRADGRSSSAWPLQPFARRRFPFARTRFWHGKSGLEDASQHSRKTRSRTLSIFSPRHFNHLRPRTPSNTNPSLILVRGPETGISGDDPRIFAMHCHRLIPDTDGKSLCLTIQLT